MNSVFTEQTDNKGNIVLYDADCAFCTRWARRGERWLTGRGFHFAPLPEQTEEMKVITASGMTLGGADAAVYLARHIWWAWPVWAVSRAPGMMRLFDWGYRRLAANRYCLKGRCGVRRTTSVWPVILLPTAALMWRSALPAWVFMWAMVASLFYGAVGLTGWRPRIGKVQAWPGLVKMAVGAALFWGVARWLPSELARGWVGMIGLVSMLHFGLAHWLLAVSGYEPIMHAPVKSRSVKDFWSGRWNRAFTEMVRPLVFEPVAKRWGAGTAMMVVFGLSGLAHELVISLPAGGGYGLPTAYFVLQGVAMCVERKLRHGRRLLAWVVVAGPVFWLFHPQFVERVIIPMMEAMRAI